jgi:hypothetical protein
MYIEKHTQIRPKNKIETVHLQFYTFYNWISELQFFWGLQFPKPQHFTLKKIGLSSFSHDYHDHLDGYIMFIHFQTQIHIEPPRNKLDFTKHTLVLGTFCILGTLTELLKLDEIGPLIIIDTIYMIKHFLTNDDFP